ncbi:MAG: proton-conducting transporter membrane subunit, partial [Bacteroidota bacterium]
MLSSFFVLAIPILFILVAIVSWFQPGIRPNLVKNLITYSTIFGILLSGYCSYLVYNYGLLEIFLVDYQGLGISLRLDAVSVIMLTMISLLAFIIARFSLNYLDGDQRQGRFLGRLAATISSVQFLVLAGNLLLLVLAWILTSVALHRLLIFYFDRPGSLIAAKKKFVVARLGDLSLIGAAALIFNFFGTGNLEVIFQAIQTDVLLAALPFELECAAILLAFAAIFKSAQFPTHGWLIEVMETPTPVSALLHAGLLNAGPFLIIRMAFLIEASYYTPLLLISIGGFTALFGSVVYLTQSSIKTALGFSSVAHMGFSLMVCGMGVFPAAMLHLVAHSFYKAHAFLSTGSVIDTIRANKIKGIRKTGGFGKMLLGIFLGAIIYTGFAFAWCIDPVNEFSLLAIGAIIVLGLSRLFTSALDSGGSFALFGRASLLSLIVAISFFTLEEGMHLLMGKSIPALTMPSTLGIVLISIVMALFILAVVLQMMAPSI